MELSFFRSNSVYTLLALKTQEESFEDRGVESFENKIQRYKSNWLNHTSKMENARIPKLIMYYKPRGH